MLKDGSVETRYLYKSYCNYDDEMFPFYEKTIIQGFWDKKRQEITLSGLLYSGYSQLLSLRSDGLSVVKNKKKLYATDIDKNLFKGYTKDTWKDIEEAFNNEKHIFGFQESKINRMEVLDVY